MQPVLIMTDLPMANADGVDLLQTLRERGHRQRDHERGQRRRADLARDPALANPQIHRFLILHKELDADDGELTRTRKVRRGSIGEKYAELVAALYDGRSSVHVSAQVRYEDGRTGSVSARATTSSGTLSLRFSQRWWSCCWPGRW